MQIAWNRINTLLLVLVLLVLVGALANGVLGGPLDPPAPPASTMKTLDQVEPRVPVYAPLDGIFPIIISKPGSYYLTENITGIAAKDGIDITAHDVTLDLNGFALNGVASSGRGVYSTGWNTAVSNGSVSYWGSHGIFLGGANSRVAAIQARSNGGDGAHSDQSSSIVNLTASNNAGSGIYLAAAGLVRDSYAANNGGYGIYASGSAYVATIVESNDIVANNIGILAGYGATVRDNTLSNNASGGISVPEAWARVEANNVIGEFYGTSAWGIKVTGMYNFIVRNSASRNVDNFDIAVGNTTGPEETGTATSPWSNVNY